MPGSETLEIGFAETSDSPSSLLPAYVYIRLHTKFTREEQLVRFSFVVDMT